MTIRRDVSELLAAQLAAGATIKDAAAQVGIGEKTAHRRLADPTFRQRIAELRREMTNQAVGRLADAMAEAAGELRRLTGSPNEGIRLRACVALLDQGLKAVALADLDDRIRCIEERLTDARRIEDSTGENRNPTG